MVRIAYETPAVEVEVVELGAFMTLSGNAGNIDPVDETDYGNF